MRSVAGLLVGTIVGITGVGGGALMTPILVLMFGIAPQTAVGTDLLYASITRCSAWRCTTTMARWTGASCGAWPWAACPPRPPRWSG
jgi:uncharacterized membrane protein YfcA